MRRILLLFTLLFLHMVYLHAQDLDKGTKLYKSNKYDEAAKVLERISSRSAEYGKAQYLLGRIAFDQNDFDESVDFFKEAVEKEPTAENYTWLGNAYGRYTQGLSKIRQGMVAPKIKKNYEKALELDPNAIDALKGLMEYYSQAPSIMGGSFEKAEEKANAILSLDKKEGYLALVTVYQRQEDIQKAENAYVKLVELDSAYRFSFGVFYQNHQKFEKAFRLYSEMVERDSSNNMALYQIGRTSALWGEKPTEGITALELYLTRDLEENAPSYAGAQMRLAMIYEKQGNKDAARRLYGEALKEDPEMQEAKQGLKRVGK